MLAHYLPRTTYPDGEPLRRLTATARVDDLLRILDADPWQLHISVDGVRGTSLSGIAVKPPYDRLPCVGSQLGQPASGRDWFGSREAEGTVPSVSVT